MKKSIASHFAVYAFLCLANDNDNLIPDPEFEVKDDDLSKVLQEIFSVDPVSGLPKGDIAYYLSPDGNPQVKAWLSANLLAPRAKQVGTDIDGVTDDVIEEFSRRSGESGYDYVHRLSDMYISAKSEYEKSLSLDFDDK